MRFIELFEEWSPQDGLEQGPPYPAEQTRLVTAMQMRLTYLGYSVGPAGFDGKYGPRTADAVAEFKNDFDIEGPGSTIDYEELIKLSKAEPVKNPTSTGNLEPGTGEFGGSESDAATIRYNNPGAMYPANWQRRFGGTDPGTRIGGGHRIALFPDRVSGAAALFALLDGRLYRNKSLADALRTWTGNNNAGTYIDFMQRRGINPRQQVSDFLASEEAAIALGSAMARWETGHTFPMSQSEWRDAYRRSGVA